MKITLTTIFAFCSFVNYLNANECQSAIGKILEKSIRAGDTEPQLIAKLEERKSYNENVCNMYTFHTRNLNLKPGQKLIFSTRNCLGKTLKMYDAFVDNTSNIIIILPNQQVPLECYKQVIGGMCLGESVDFILSTPNYEKGIATHIVIHPIEACTLSGQKISAELRSLDGEIYEIIGEGFLPNEKLKILNISEMEGGFSTIDADENGNFSYIYMPKVVNLYNGEAHTTIFRANQEPLTIHFSWGSKNVKPMRENKDNISSN